MNAVTVIAEAVASMPCYLYALKEDGVKESTVTPLNIFKRNAKPVIKRLTSLNIR